jgi:hypothetical protein
MKRQCKISRVIYVTPTSYRRFMVHWKLRKPSKSKPVDRCYGCDPYRQQNHLHLALGEIGRI